MMDDDGWLVREIIPFYGRTVQVSELLQITQFFLFLLTGLLRLCLNHIMDLGHEYHEILRDHQLI